MRGSMAVSVVALVLGSLTLAALGPLLPRVDAQTPEIYNLFEATHYGHDLGNWNVGLWRYYGDGTRIAYRVSCPAGGSVYPGGPVNSGGSSRVYWGSGGSATHAFALSYDPTTRALSLSAVGTSTVTELSDSPRVTAQSVCDPPVELFAGGEVGKVNNLLMVIQATAGTDVNTCGPASSGCKKQSVQSCTTQVSNLFLDGTPVTGFTVSADQSEDPGAASFTKQVESNLTVPDDQAWVMTGDLIVTCDLPDDAYVPKQSRVGLTAYGQYVSPLAVSLTGLEATSRGNLPLLAGAMVVLLGLGFLAVTGHRHLVGRGG